MGIFDHILSSRNYMLLRALCWMTGHDWRTIKKDNTIWVRECKFCGKVERIILI